jgi:hypothetical protein
MNKLFAVVLTLASASVLAACGGGQKQSTAPVGPGGSNGSAFGGASYGGHKSAAPTNAPDATGAPTAPAANPCAGK